jgi:hypothetical protein
VGEALRHACLVYEEPAWTQHARYLTQCRTSPIHGVADVVAGAEIDDEIEASPLEREVADVALDERRVRARVAHPFARFGQQVAIDVQPDQLDGLEAVIEDGQRYAASTPDLEHPRPAREP